MIDAISDYLRAHNANTGGAYATSQETDSVISGARAAMADSRLRSRRNCFWAEHDYADVRYQPCEIGRELKAGDEILLTHLDHDANISRGGHWKSAGSRSSLRTFMKTTHLNLG